MGDGQVLEHVIRRASLPWRPPATWRTECGKPATEHASISYDDFVFKIRKQGQQRASLSTCMTCWTTASRYQPWSVDPVDALRREVQLGRDPGTLRHELWAIAALIDAHRDEFDAYLQGLQQTTDLAARRQAKRTTH